MIIITHIEKTGGSSVRKYLQNTFGSRLYEAYQQVQQRRLQGLPAWRRWFDQLRARLPGRWKLPFGTACIIGHVHLTRWGHLFPNAQHATWLRDPVDRVVSHYHHTHRVPNPDNPFYRSLMGKDLSLADFAEIPLMRNRQSSMLDGWPLDRLAFVGLTEQFAASLQLFSRVFCLPPPAIIPEVGRNPQRSQSHYQVEPALREHIRSLNQADEQLYQEGLRRFGRLCQEHGVPWASEAQPAQAS